MENNEIIMIMYIKICNSDTMLKKLLKNETRNHPSESIDSDPIQAFYYIRKKWHRDQNHTKSERSKNPLHPNL